MEEEQDRLAQKLKCFNLSMLATFLQNASSDNQNPYKHRQTLDPRGKYILEWEVNWSEKRVIFNVTVETNGYVGFGLSKKGQMSGADIVIGGVDPSGRVYFSDYYVPNGSRVPERDASQDWILHTGLERNNQTFLSFSRKFETCDEEQDVPISTDLLTLIWAYGEVDEDAQYHFEKRGVYNAYLLDPIYSLKSSESNLFNITRTLFVPEKETTYWCNFHKVPTNSKHHIIGFNPIFPSEQSQRHIHHFLLFRCVAPEGIEPEALFEGQSQTGGRECYVQVEVNTLEYKYCKEIVYAWAVGGKGIFFPDHVGVPMSEDGTEYFSLQIHYDNFNLLPNLRISSTLQIHYSSELRNHDLAILGVGEFFPGPTSIYIPPNSLNHIIIGHCAPGCTRRILPPEGINVVAALTHSHISSKGMRILHFRDKKELPWLLNDDNYNPSYQPFRMLRKERKILPGDQLSVRCLYDTIVRNGSTTAGGFSTRQEMCDAPLYYYNKIPGRFICLSQIRAKEYFDLLGIGNVTWNDQRKDFTILTPQQFSGLTMEEYGNRHLNWDIAMRNEIQRQHLEQTHVSMCPNNLSV
ncbi:unnamed protein product [Orchesella dallaii]|uniref:DOMON domain-containing protein n=1 Tax=Orchesella dallaii TaxID=48710 RepID=A0ABP1RIL3_9HEXA